MLALHRLSTESARLDSEAVLEQQVYVSSRLSPESFTNPTFGGGVLLRFVRPSEFSAWQLDEKQFLIIEDK